MMRRLGLDDRWVSKVMTCVTTVSYTVLVNGQPDQKITPTRGIRRGDPIFPYLYLICVESLCTLLHDVESS